MDFGGESQVDVPIIEVDAAIGHQSGRHGKASAPGWAPEQGWWFSCGRVREGFELVVELVGHEEILGVPAEKMLHAQSGAGNLPICRKSMRSKSIT